MNKTNSMLNDTGNVTDIILVKLDSVRLAFYIFSCCLTFLVLTCNIVMLVVLLKSQNLRKKRYIVLVMSLGFGDLMISLGSLFWLISQVIHTGVFFMCCAMASLFAVGVFMSVYFTFIICLNRYLTAIDSSYVNKLYAGKRKFLLMFLPSVSKAALTFGISFRWDRNITSCAVNTIGKEKIPFTTLFTITSVPFLLATLLLYIFSFRAIFKRFSQIQPVHTIFILPPDTDNGNTEARKKRKLAALKTLGIILFFLLVGTARFVLSFPLTLFGIELKQEYRVILTWLLIINSTANPVVYTWRFRELRTELRKRFCCCFT